MEFRLLGPVQALADGQSVPLGAPKQRALLVELLLHKGEVVPRAHLIDSLWGEQAPESAARALQVYVHGLRRALGAERIQTHGNGYRATVAADELDLDRFESLLAGAAAKLADGAPAAAAVDVQEALGLWRGAALADLSEQPVAETAAASLDERRLVALELRNDIELRLGRHETVLADIEPLVAEHPYRERLREQWILALYRAGRQKEALDAYRATRELLIDELGVEPGPALQELERAVLRQDDALAAPAPRETPAALLPTPPTSLVGRRLEVAAVSALLREEARLVTLTGPGGTGKTRLALAVAEELGGERSAGVAFVDLAPVNDPSLVGELLAAALEAGGALLLLVDNFEHLQAAATELSAVLAATPDLRVLATSRVPLRLSGEHEYPVPPLPTDDAVRLFSDRARAVDPSFELNDAGADAVAEICRRLDGLPLAIELAAARTRVLPPPALAARIGQALDLLVEGARDLPERQRTLRATLDWSFRLLSEAEQALLARLSVFAGGVTLDAAEAVVGGGLLPQLSALVDGNLLRRVSDAPRFAMLETIRDYAGEQLRASGEAGEYARRHALHFLAVAEAANAVIAAADEGYERAFDTLENDHDNLRSALAWAVERGEVEVQARLAVSLRWFWVVRGHGREGRVAFARAIADTEGAADELRALVLVHGGTFPYREGALDEAKALWTEALDLYRKLGDAEGIARCIAELGAVAVSAGELETAAAAYRESLELFERLGSHHRASVALANLAAIAELQGDHETSATYGERAVAEQRSRGDLDGMAISLHNLARSRLALGELEEARANLAETFEVAERLGYRELIAYSLETAGELAYSQDDRERAVRLLGASVELFDAIGVEMSGAERAGYERILESVTAALGRDRVDELLAAGRGLETADAVRDARGEG